MRMTPQQCQNHTDRIIGTIVILIITIIFFFSSTLKAEQEADKLLPRREEGSLLFDNIPPIPAAIQDRMVQYQNNRSVMVQEWDPTGRRILISTRFGETTQLHTIEKPDGMRRQITFFDNPVYYGTFCPDTSNNGLLFTMDKDGSEAYQIYYYDCLTGKNRLLTDGHSRHGDPLWSNKGDRFAYLGMQRNGTDWDIYLRDFNGNDKKERHFPLQGAWSPMAWSPDDTKLLVAKFVSANESSLHLLDYTTGYISQLNPKPYPISYTDAVWDRNGRGLYLISDDESDLSTVRYHDISMNTTTPLKTGINWNIMELELSPDGRTLAFTTNEHGAGSLYLYSTVTHRSTKINSLPWGRVYGLRFDRGGKRLTCIVSSSVEPGDLYVLPIGGATIRPQRWTQSETGGLPATLFTKPSVVHYPTFDSIGGIPRQIPAYYFRPTRGKPPYPVLIKIHGGPESQYWPQFDAVTQYYVNEMQMAVIAPNVRGSAGYGKEYLQLDNGYQRENSVKDIGALIEWIAQQPELDAARIGLSGGSYGGYMVLASMIRYREKIRCGIDIYGISSFVTFLENTQGYRRDLRRVEYGNETDSLMRKFLVSISPLTRIDEINKPLFVIQGANDPRVPVTESEQVVSRIRKNKGEVWYLLARDEGHGFGKKSNSSIIEQAIVLFLETYLR